MHIQFIDAYLLQVEAQDTALVLLVALPKKVQK
jgi:hypothetical protein